MADSSGGGKKWLMYGCFGCLGFVGLVILVVGSVFGLAFLKTRAETIEQQALSRELPVVAAPADATEPADGATGPVTPEGVPGRSVMESAAGHLVLDLRHAEFYVTPGEPGDSLRVEAEYDTRSYVLEEALDDEPGQAWTYRVDFRRSGSSLVTAIKEMMSGSRPVVRIWLPVDTPMSLDARFAEGGSQVELGGLWLTDVDLTMNKGGVEIAISEPLRAPVRRMSIEGSMGGMDVSRLGNASPGELDIDFSMGGLNADLRGAWVQDSKITVNSSMGGAVLRLPRDVTIVGLETSRLEAPESVEIDRPTLTFDVTAGMGEVEFID